MELLIVSGRGIISQELPWV